MSPEEQRVDAFIRRAVDRSRAIAIAWRVAWTIAAAAAGAEVALVIKLPVLTTTIAVGFVGLVASLRRRMVSRAEVVARLERAEPAYRNVLITANELADLGEVRAQVRARVFADAAARSDRVDLGRAIPASRAVRLALIACAAWAAVGVTKFEAVGVGIANRARRPIGAREGAPLSSPSLRTTATIDPPGYTRQPPSTIVDPSALQAIEGSELTLRIEAPSPHVVVTHDGVSRRIDRDPGGRFVDRESLSRTGYLLVDAAPAGRRSISIVVASDALPSVRLAAPGRDLMFSGGNPRIVFDARATDDFGLRSLALRYTKVSGSGEQFEFQEGEIPLAVDRATPRDWHGSATRALAELGLKDGDMLVYRAVASDARPVGGSASSDAFFIEMSKLGAAAGDAFTLPEQETRYALSEQMLIVKTERLDRQRATMAAPGFAESAINLGVEQRMIRAEFVFMLGGEVENEEVEAEQSTELQEGRLQNYGQSDLRSATATMSRAEKLLTAGNTADALKAEREAVVALQRAFTKDRYILRALASRSQLDLSRRLTGDLSRAVDWRRPLPNTPENRRAARLQDLLRGIGDLKIDAGDDPAAGRVRAEALAEETLRTDAASSALRDAAGSLQRLADTWTATDRAGRTRAIASISAIVVGEARRALAGASPLDEGERRLRSAFADALRPRGSR